MQPRIADGCYKRASIYSIVRIVGRLPYYWGTPVHPSCCSLYQFSALIGCQHYARSLIRSLTAGQLMYGSSSYLRVLDAVSFTTPRTKSTVFESSGPPCWLQSQASIAESCSWALEMKLICRSLRGLLSAKYHCHRPGLGLKF